MNASERDVLNKKKAVFVDRDGTLNEMVYDETHGTMDSPRRAEQVVMLPHAGAFLESLRALGYLVVVVTNQPGIAKGTLSEDDLSSVNERLAKLVAEDGGTWDELMYSPYHPTGGPWARPEYVRVSECRKPAPGMLVAAAEKHGVDLGQSWMVGDGLADVQAGRAAGCRTVLVSRLKVGDIERFISMENAEPDFVAADLPAALDIIRKNE